MTGLAALCVGLAAAAVLWPWPGRRARRRRILQPAPRRLTGWLGAGWLAPPWLRRAGAWVHGSTAGPPRAPGRDRDPAGRGPLGTGGTPRAGRLPLLAPVLAAGTGVLLSGLVAGVVAGAYAAVAARLVVRRHAERTRVGHRAGQLDLLAAAAADLRAGLPASAALTGVCGDRDDPLQSRVRAAVVLAERTGAPLAGVLEQIEADARGSDRARAVAAAQTAGSRATAWLLAGLPFGGIALGYAIGTDPLRVLLHTPIGAVCALGAVALQLAGLFWAGRIARMVPAVGS